MKAKRVLRGTSSAYGAADLTLCQLFGTFWNGKMEIIENMTIVIWHRELEAPGA